MLKLQRASAGSGKTYTLTKTYIFNVIAAKDKDSDTFRLRDVREIPDAVRSILAITFTNKATDEMKNRIVEKLHDLTSYKPDKDIDYLTEFMETLHCSRSQIRTVAMRALEFILDEYSSFSVSTIDSFFQLILRTFAYEIDLNQNYRIEISSDDVNTMGVENSLDSISMRNKDSRHLARWLKRLMRENFHQGNNWNIFARSKSNKSIYKSLLKLVAAIESEEFQQIREELDAYFAKEPDFFKIIDILNSRYDLSRFVKEAKKIAENIKAMMADREIANILYDRKHLATYLNNILSSKKNTLDSKVKETLPEDAKTTPKDANKKTLLIDIEDIKEEVVKLNKVVDRYLELKQSPDFIVWQCVREVLPWLKLILDVAGNTQNYLEEIGSMKLSDTNALLRNVISDDDTPFVYERLGTRFSHFLIDEFQDTSRMQWDNLRPLVGESLANHNDNLIIGDAKQSIYRFRNADSSLITSVVPGQFGSEMVYAGNSKAENTNWRSDRIVVGFNNFLFHNLAAYLDNDLHTEELPRKYAELYNNVVQYPRHQENNGYVEMRLYKVNSNNVNYGEKDEDDEICNKMCADIPGKIAELIGRGYHQRDIAVLVPSHKTGGDVIDAIIKYNNRETTVKPIDFVSEQSLYLSASPAVRIIVATLEAILKGAKSKINTTGINTGIGVANWRDIAVDYNFFALQHPGMRPEQLIDEFIKSESPADGIKDLLEKMPTYALPALVEGIVESFVQPIAMRKRQAPFIAAFQDFVLDYCSSCPSDIASFLKYWDSKKDSLSISSPDDTDAVQIMTIHKSKGLEFKCVIVPDMKLNWNKSDINELAWVVPEYLPEANPDVEFPPYLPLKLNNSLAELTNHSDVISEDMPDPPYRQIFLKARYLKLQDSLNQLYVAYTRAVNELYVFSRATDTMRKNLHGILHYKLPEFIANIADIDSRYHPEWMISSEDFSIVSNGDVVAQPPKYTDMDDSDWFAYKFGTPYAVAPYKEEKNETVVKKHMEDYPAALENCLLQFRPASDDTAASLPLPGEAADFDDPDDDDSNPRAFGTMMHAVMEDIYTLADRDRAYRRMRLRAMLTRQQQQEARRIIDTALQNPETRAWFDGSLRVLNERSLLRKGKKTLRPDRIMTAPDGSIHVVDYKFGLTDSPDTDKKYLRQVEEYARNLRLAGYQGPIHTFVWYLRQNRILPGNVF